MIDPATWLAQHPDVQGALALLTLTATHLVAYLRDARADVARLLVKGAPMSSTSPIITALEQDLPALIRGTKAIAKALLDTVYTTGTPDEKAAQLTAQLEPKFNQQLQAAGLPAWALGMIDGVFATIVRVTVAAVEAEQAAA